MLPENESVLPVLSQLNEKQRDAVVSEEKRILILAGAGSGKTKTLIQKVIYLISEKNVDPQNILAITFTKNAANEMIDRLIAVSNKENDYQQIITNKKINQTERDQYRREYMKKYPWLSNISVKTFHGLCNRILRKRGGPEFDTKYKILSDNLYDVELESRQIARETPEEIINKIINILCEDPDYLLQLKRYILDYYVDEYNVKLYEKGLTQYEKPFTTLKGDHVASKAERDVADWFYRHHITYHYEPMIAPGKFEMQPDFYIDDANIYLEVVSSKSYYLKDKEQAMKEAGENYLKLHDSGTHDSNLFNTLMDKYILSRVDKNLLNTSPLDVAEEFRGYERFRRFFVLDVLKMIDKIKVENRNFDEIYEKAQKDDHARIRDFYTLSKVIWQTYHRYCIDVSYLDFNDLLIRTVSLLENNPKIKEDYQNQFKYILVDEFQDVNTVQVKLLNYLLNEENQLFCVGDDWQSIYGFRGSNVEYIVNFEKFFENPKLIKLDINYRSNGTIVEASNQVISHNKFKIDKEIKSLSSSGKKIYLYCAENEVEDGVDTVITNVDKLLQNGYTKEDILVLSRTRKTEAFDRYYNLLRARRIRITTIHQSKGLEAKVVFIIGLTRGYQGFPNIRDDDRIFQLIKKSDYELNLEEERRLFYVALTRAKEELFLISEVGNESDFIREIPGEFLDRTNFLILNLTNQKPKYCLSCEEKIQEDYIYCPYCGITIDSKNLSDNNIQIIGVDDESLLNQLREWRLKKAREKKIPPYCIFHDKTLFEIVRKKPHNFTELKNVFGMGNKTINQYGEELLDFINNNESEITERIEQKEEVHIENECNKIILSCLKDLKFVPRKTLLCQILKGSIPEDASETKKNENKYYGTLNENKYYGTMNSYDSDRILFLIDYLIENGLIIIYDEKRNFGDPFIQISSKGEQLLLDSNRNQVQNKVEPENNETDSQNDSEKDENIDNDDNEVKSNKSNTDEVFVNKETYRKLKDAFNRRDKKRTNDYKNDG